MNTIDTAASPFGIFPKVGRALRGCRDRFIIGLHLGLTFREDGQYVRSRDLDVVKRNFDEQLEALGTDFADIAYIHYVDELDDYEKVFQNGIYDYAQQLKKEGRIRKVGFGTHRASIGLKFLQDGAFDVFMFSINPAYDLDPVSPNPLEEDFSKFSRLAIAKERAELYHVAQKLGVGITVMKPLGAGRLLDVKTSPFKRAMTVPQCIQYCLDRPAVLSCIVGVRNLDELKQLVAYYRTSPSERDYAFIAGMQHEEMMGKCVYCNHCLPCPSNIDIASVHKFLYLYKMGDELAKQHYLALEHTASDCVACSSCEENCPFDVPVREKMKDAVEVFGI